MALKAVEPVQEQISIQNPSNHILFINYNTK